MSRTMSIRCTGNTNVIKILNKFNEYRLGNDNWFFFARFIGEWIETDDNCVLEVLRRGKMAKKMGKNRKK